MKVPYPMTAAMKLEERHAQMFHALQLGLPRLAQQPINEAAHLSIAAYGPSLLETWQDIRPPILSMSGATRFLADRGITVDYHVDMDPRAHKAQHLDPPVPGVHYIMATVCPPKTWELLKDQRVTLFHVYSGKNEQGNTYDWVAQHDPGQLVMHAGSTIGLTSIHVGGVLGFRHFEIFGMDGSFDSLARTARHAGPHYGHQQQDGITWDAGGETYATSKIMANAVTETLNTCRFYPIFTVFHGRGLTQALIRESNFPNACCADETEKAKRVRSAVARILDSQDVDASMVLELQQIAAKCETLRKSARYNTGSVTLETMILLRQLCRELKPKVIIEIGTFIGKSTWALQASEMLYTCDESNHCLANSEKITCFPYQSSTQMLEQLVAKGVKADLFFFDGRIRPQDLPLIFRLSWPTTTYVTDDYFQDEKGVANMKFLEPWLPHHQLQAPMRHTADDKRPPATLALLRPR